MKNTIKQIALVVVIATITTSAHASWTDTVTGYWNSACTNTKNAAQATGKFFARNWFFATHLYSLKQISAKIKNNQEITPDEYQAIKKAIRYSTLSEQEKQGCYIAFDRAPRLLTLPIVEGAPAEGFTLNAAIQKLQEIIQQQQAQYIKATAAVTTGIVTGVATVYAYKRLTARPALPGWYL